MTATTEPLATQPHLPLIENESATGRVILVCEHASNAIPARWGDLGLSAAERAAHIAWDPGALGLARGLAARLEATLIHAPVSRLIYDCNRAPDMAGAMPARSEVHEVPGNAAITPTERANRTAALYVPFHAALHGLISMGMRLNEEAEGKLESGNNRLPQKSGWRGHGRSICLGPMACTI